MKHLLAFLSLLSSVIADPFSDYWYSGDAEIAVYDLKQTAYGEVRQGTATLIFVTEPFSRKKHVKIDQPQNAGKDRATVLKLNKAKKYITGIYPYSILSSAFCEVGAGTLLKANTSVQEWCGHTFIQATRKGAEKYSFSQYSYFESQGDISGTVTQAALEEQLLLQLRLGTLDLKVQKMLPLQEYCRLYHLPYQPYKVRLTEEIRGKNKVITVYYDTPAPLKTEIIVSQTFPYIIQGWAETYTKGGNTYTNTATLQSVQKLPYWEMNASKFEKKRSQIGLE